MPDITTIRLSMPFNLGSVNCYLIESNSFFFLIDTGSSNRRGQLELELEHAGCLPGKLKLLILTHGDFDHTGNASHLRQKYGVQVAMHKADAAMVRYGDMFTGRKQPGFIIRKLLPALSGFHKKEMFSPDIFVEDNFDFSRFGLHGKVLSLPGHSQGSIGILTEDGDLFCGDLFENLKKPALGSIMDDLVRARSSAGRLKKFRVNTIYPGHGMPFQLKENLHLIA